MHQKIPYLVILTMDAARLFITAIHKESKRNRPKQKTSPSKFSEVFSAMKTCLVQTDKSHTENCKRLLELMKEK